MNFFGELLVVSPIYMVSYSLVCFKIQSMDLIDHKPMIIHADLKPVSPPLLQRMFHNSQYHVQDNILININGVPFLSDFGISTVYDDDALWNTTTKSVPGTI